MPAESTSSGDYFRVCSTCKKPIAFEAQYYRCSVSTCNRPKLAMFFCSVPCWDAHVPEARHRDAWAEPTRAPSRVEWEAAKAAEAEEDEPETDADNKAPRERRVVTTRAEQLPRDVLVVVSKLKSFVKASSGFNTSDGVVDVLSDHLRRLCELAAEVAAADGRKTVLDRDFKTVLKSLQRS